MPVLDPQLPPPAVPAVEPTPGRRASRAFPVCANPRCSSGWLQLWRRRRVPVVEGGWLCSPACTRAHVEGLLRREQSEVYPVSTHHHRVPIGLVLLTQGWITHEHLKEALEAQRSGANMRLGEWLVANRGLSEARLTQALGLQWSCPVFSLERHGGGLPATIVPRVLAETFGFVPLRLTATGILYLAFEDRIDHSLTLAVERMTGLRVESGLLSTSEFRRAQQDFTQGRFARSRMIEAGSIELLAEAFARHIEKRQPVQARVVRLHDLFWLRLWHQDGEPSTTSAQNPGPEDIIGSVAGFA